MKESMPDLDFAGHQKDLQPFATVYREVLFQQATRTRKWPLGQRKRRQIASAVDNRIVAELGHPLHPVITYFALRVCCHFHHLWTEELQSNREWKRHQIVIDRAWRLIQAMEEHYGVEQLKTLCY